MEAEIQDDRKRRSKAMPILLRTYSDGLWDQITSIAQKYGLRGVDYCTLWRALWYTKIWSIAHVFVI